MVKVNTEVGLVMRQVQNSRLFDANDFKNVQAIIWYLRTIKENNTADWVEQNQSLYLQGLLDGFEIDMSQEAQFRDLNSQTLRNQSEKNLYINKNK